MVDVDFSALNDNPTLGEEGNGNFLDVVRAQKIEDDRAEAEDRSAKTVVPKPKWPRTVEVSNDSGYVDWDYESEE